MASLVGALYYSTHNPVNGKPDAYGPQWYFSGLTQGFVVYLAVLGGLLILGEVPVENVSTQKYVHLAGALSVMSFWAGYTPHEFLEGLLKRLRTTPEVAQNG